jgi:leucyl aminopeptidase
MKRTESKLSLKCWILPLTDRELPLRDLSEEGARQQYRKQLEQIRSQSGGEATRFNREPFQSVRVNYTSGAASIYLLIEHEISTYELHEAIRKTFEAPFKDFTQILCNLTRLDGATQARAAFAMSFLKETHDWNPTSFGHKSKAPAQKSKAKTSGIIFDSRLSKQQERELRERAQFLGEANNEVRSLAELPANELTPRHYKERVKKYATRHGLGFEFMDHRELTRRKAGAFLAVSRSYPEGGAGIVKLVYKPKRAKAGLLTLVGKGVCFDTGGYNIKGSQSMFGMHGDMTGSAVALAVCGYFARRKVPFEVHAYLALAENLISPTAYKPNEVVVACDGTSIEVVDTDAEGRMILSDTLALARKEKPSLVIDFATLTYTAVKSLDTRKAAVFSNRAELARLAVEAGETSGERAWSFPLDRDYRKSLESKVADIRQCASSDHADHVYAATFLSHFVGDETPWLHVDLACAENKGGLGLISSDTTGFGVLWAEELVRQVSGSSGSFSDLKHPK